MTPLELDALITNEGGLLLRMHANMNNEVTCAVILKPDGLVIIGHFGRDDRSWAELEKMQEIHV